MIKRTIATKVLELAKKYPVISITGPRQSGKTSLCQELFSTYQYKNLENPDELALAKADPKSFIGTGTGKKIIFDEVQKHPELLSYLQSEVDAQKIDGQFVITGSQNFAISAGISQSLAGRVANFTLLPLSVLEIDQTKSKPTLATSIPKTIFRGFYPRPLVKQIQPKDFYRDYVATYVERDVRQIQNIGDLRLFQKFLQLVAGRVGQLVNYSSLANDVGVTHKTIESWLSVLEASYLIFTLQPYYKNLGKRVTKSPKLFFYDVGLLCYLLGVQSDDQLQSHHAYGNIFENFIITEIKKNIYNHSRNEKMYFWRDSNGNEVDLLLDSGSNQHAIEIKSGQTFSTDMLKGLRYWQTMQPSTETLHTLVYTGDIQQKIQDIELKNWHTLLAELAVGSSVQQKSDNLPSFDGKLLL